MQVAKIIHDTKSGLVLCVTEAGDGFVGIYNPRLSDGTDSYFSISGDTTPGRYKVFCCCQSCLRWQLDWERIMTVVAREIPELTDFLQKIGTDVASRIALKNYAIAVVYLSFPLAIKLWGISEGVTQNILTPETDGLNLFIADGFSSRAQSDYYPFFSEHSNIFEVAIAPAEEAA